MKNIEHLRDVIRSLHDVEATHIASVPVTGLFRGKTVWEGTVEVFQLHSHTRTTGQGEHKAASALQFSGSEPLATR